MALFYETYKLIKQMRGTEDIFGYRSTSINQVYLLYCLSGKIYTTDKIHWQVKLAWLIITVVGLGYAYVALFFNLGYGERNDLTFILSTTYATIIATSIDVILPLVTLRYSDDIERMILLMDDFEKTREPGCASCRRHTCPRNMLDDHWVPIFVAYSVYVNVCALDVAVFYERYKVENYMYWLVAFPKLAEMYPNGETYFGVHFVVAITSNVVMLKYFAILKLFFMWALVCQKETMKICDHINTATKTYIDQYYIRESWRVRYIEKSKSTDDVFVRDLIPYLETLKNVKKLAETLRPYYQLFSAAIFATAFLPMIAHFYFIRAADLDIPVKCKEAGILGATAILTFYICQVGDIFGHTTEIISLEIYSTPWYLLEPKYRRDILQILCQTQGNTEVRVFKVYPINVNYFIRLMSRMYSATNVLVTATSK